MPQADQAGFSRILEHLRQTRGVDFSAYKPTSLLRRVRKRMGAVEIAEFDAYLDYLQVHPDEFGALFNAILINVTSFFRDVEVWEALRTTVTPDIMAGDKPLRVWSAGCASGQEAYSAAILLAEALGIEAYRDRVKIYATDVDEEALAESRRATYSARQVSHLPADVVGKYFERGNGDVYNFSADLRRAVIFGRHDLIQDPPISRIDLLLCRNTMMYFNAEAQARIMARFAFSLNAGGCLVLGRAEMPTGDLAMFQRIDLSRRIFRVASAGDRRPRPRSAEPQQQAGTGGERTADNDVGLNSLQDELTRSRRDLEATGEQLRFINAELDTTNQALRSGIEKLETTAEELQTMNDAVRNPARSGMRTAR